MHIIAGVLLAVVAGVINGLFAVPMKLARHWQWENLWLVFTILGLVLYPRAFALRGIPRLEEGYAQLGFATLVIPVLWGAVIYTGSLLFGRSMVYLGTALSFALLVGTMSMVGVLAPILVYAPATLGTTGGAWILSGVGCLFVAVAACARAGVLKAGAGAQSRSGAVLGMALAIVGGALSGLLSFGLNTGWAKAIGAAAVRSGGAAPANAANAVLLLVLLGGAVPNVLYCAWLLSKNGTWVAYRKHGSYWLILLLVGLMYYGSTALWGISTSPTMLGRLGPSVGSALFIGAMAVSSNVGGFATGEWKDAGTKARRIMIAGISLMVAAMALVGYGNLLLNAA